MWDMTFYFVVGVDDDDAAAAAAGWGMFGAPFQLGGKRNIWTENLPIGIYSVHFKKTSLSIETQ